MLLDKKTNKKNKNKIYIYIYINIYIYGIYINDGLHFAHCLHYKLGQVSAGDMSGFKTSITVIRSRWTTASA